MMKHFFFFPTILSNTHEIYKISTSKSPPSQFHIICLSTGDFCQRNNRDRIDELNHAMSLVSTKNKIHLHVVNNEKLKDHPKNYWNSSVIADEIDHYVQKSIICNQVKLVDMKELTLCIFTFDGMGSSGHLNHIATYDGVFEYIQTQTQNNKYIPVIGYALQTIPLYRRYIPFSEVFLSFIAYYRNNYMITRRSMYNQKEINKNTIVYRVFNPWLAWKVFVKHASQMIWYRRFSILFSCCMYMNAYTVISHSIKIDFF